jgi:hypothetical protein
MYWSTHSLCCYKYTPFQALYLLVLSLTILLFFCLDQEKVSKPEKDTLIGGGKIALSVVSRLVAIEEFAGTDILCSDKTGTLAQNKLTMGEPFSVQGVLADQVVFNADLASSKDNQDTIDLAVLGGVRGEQVLKE